MKKKTIAILGSTGSIGQSALEIIKKTNEYKVELLIVNKNYFKALDQIKFFKPKLVVVHNEKVYLKIKKKFYDKKIIILSNIDNIKKYITQVDVTVSAIPGIAGLEPTLIFTQISKKILLANKEAIICGWKLIKKISIKYKTELVPIDSEHFSINMLLKNYPHHLIEKVYITASGGPFLKLNIGKFKNIKPKEAIKHPKWNMGKKISVDSATLMNKVLEVAEAIKLFPFKLEQYEIVIHSNSLIHAIIKLKNGTSIFLYHLHDMKIPIGNALVEDFNYNSYFPLKKKNYDKIGNLNFITVNKKRFPSINLIHEINRRKSSSIVINAANEIFVDEFLKNNIKFNDIVHYLKLVLRQKDYIKTSNLPADSVKNIYKIDNWARKTAIKITKKQTNV